MCVMCCLCVCVYPSELLLELIHTQGCLYIVCISICYYTYWSGVADLSGRYPRADKLQHHDKRCNKMFITGC